MNERINAYMLAIIALSGDDGRGLAIKVLARDVMRMQEEGKPCGVCSCKAKKTVKTAKKSPGEKPETPPETKREPEYPLSSKEVARLAGRDESTVSIYKKRHGVKEWTREAVDGYLAASRPSSPK